MNSRSGSQLKGTDIQVLSSALRRINQVAIGAEQLRREFVALYETSSGIRGTIARAKLQSDPYKAAEALGRAIEALEAHLTKLVLITGRDLHDLLQLAGEVAGQLPEPTRQFARTAVGQHRLRAARSESDDQEALIMNACTLLHRIEQYTVELRKDNIA